MLVVILLVFVAVFLGLASLYYYSDKTKNAINTIISTITSVSIATNYNAFVDYIISNTIGQIWLFSYVLIILIAFWNWITSGRIIQ